MAHESFMQLVYTGLPNLRVKAKIQSICRFGSKERKFRVYQRAEKKPVAILSAEQQSSSRFSTDWCTQYGVVLTGLNCFKVQRGWCITLLGTSRTTGLFMHDQLAVTRYELLGMPCDFHWSPCLLLKGLVFCFACNYTIQLAVRKSMFTSHRCTNPALLLTKCSLLCWWQRSQAAKICSATSKHFLSRRAHKASSHSSSW